MIVTRRIIVFCLLLSVFLLPAGTFASATESYFSKSDYNNVAAEAEDAVITLEGAHGTLSDPTRGQSGNPVVIDRKGVYRVTGNSDGVTIMIREPKKSGNIYLVLDGVSMTNAGGPCIESLTAEKTIVQCMGKNLLVSGTEKGAPLYAEDDLTVNGTGQLEIESAKNGIHCKGVLRVTGAQMTIRAENDGLKGKDGFYMDGGSVTVEKSYEGLEGSEIVIFSGEMRINASDDGINAAGEEKLQGDVMISGGTVYINAGGDAIDSNRSILFSGGTTLVEGPANSRNSIFDWGEGDGAVLGISGGTVLAVGSAEKAKIFSSGTQYSRLELVSGHAGDVISTDDGSGVSLTASRDFSCVIYSGPNFTEDSRIQVFSASGEDGETPGGSRSAHAGNVYMQIAIQEAMEGITHHHGGPFGSVVVKDGQIVGQGHNQVLLDNDPTCHGEISALRDAGQRMGTFDLSGCELYTTGEPCPMCLCACLWANIDKIYYGCTIADNEMIGFRDEDFDELFGGRDAFGDYLECIDRDACLALYEAYLQMEWTYY